LIIFKIKDNGQGKDSMKNTNGFGSKLVKRLVKNELNGTLEYKNDNGLVCSIKFPEIKKGVCHENYNC